MAEHNDLGKKGEEWAVLYLQMQGYTILHRNWQYGKKEIDIIAKKDQFLHFIEVKTKHYNLDGHPEDNVTRKKFRNILRVADEYLYLHPGHWHIRYDILSITWHKNREPECFMIEDVFL